MAYSQDLRERLIVAVRAKEQSLDQIAETFGVSAWTVDNWVRRWRATGKVVALPRREVWLADLLGRFR